MDSVGSDVDVDNSEVNDNDLGIMITPDEDNALVDSVLEPLSLSEAFNKEVSHPSLNVVEYVSTPPVLLTHHNEIMLALLNRSHPTKQGHPILPKSYNDVKKWATFNPGQKKNIIRVWLSLSGIVFI